MLGRAFPRTRSRMPLHPLDRLPLGTPLPEGYNGTVATDHGANGLYGEGPQPATPPLARLIVTSHAGQLPPLPPVLARLALTREAVIKHRLLQMLRRARILPAQAAQPADAIQRRKRLRPLACGNAQRRPSGR